VQVARDSAFTRLVRDDNGLSYHQITYSPHAFFVQSYYWRVRAVTDGGTGPWTATRSFRVTPYLYHLPLLIRE
jgi:hypothetical protein